MTDRLITVEMPSLGTTQDDGCVQSFVLHSFGEPTTTDDTNAVNAIKGLYTNVPTGGTNSPAKYLAGYLDHTANAVTLKSYNLTGHLDGSSHGSPFRTDTLTLPTALDSEALPPQAAVAVTLRGRNALSVPVQVADSSDPGTAVDRPRSRHTGRVFWGPLSKAAKTITGGVPARPIQAFQDELMRAYEDLQDALNAAGWIWCVWSRTEEEVYGITRVEVDDSFDVIRKRKVAAATRTVRTFSPVPSLALGA